MKKQKRKNHRDNSPIVPQRNKIKNELIITQKQILSEKQKQLLDLITTKNVKMIWIEGPAGTSKTYLSILGALQWLNERRVSDLMYIRSAVESSESKLGFLPGETKDKMSPYIQPLLDKLSEFLSKEDVEYLQKENRVDSVPVGFLRGLNWNAKFIIADEAQNMTTKELTTLVTRTGEFSKIVILGDSQQSDIGSKSGFKKMFETFSDEESKENGIYTFAFTEDDIVRSALVRFIIKKLKKSL